MNVNLSQGGVSDHAGIMNLKRTGSMSFGNYRGGNRSFLIGKSYERKLVLSAYENYLNSGNRTNGVDRILLIGPKLR